VLIVPHYVLHDELCGWLCNQFTGLRIHAAADQTFKQVVIIDIGIRRQDLARPASVKANRKRFRAIRSGEDTRTRLNIHILLRTMLCIIGLRMAYLRYD
jgi:hypothetical protein